MKKIHLIISIGLIIVFLMLLLIPATFAGGAAIAVNEKNAGMRVLTPGTQNVLLYDFNVKPQIASAALSNLTFECGPEKFIDNVYVTEDGKDIDVALKNNEFSFSGSKTEKGVEKNYQVRIDVSENLSDAIAYCRQTKFEFVSEQYDGPLSQPHNLSGNIKSTTYPILIINGEPSKIEIERQITGINEWEKTILSVLINDFVISADQDMTIDEINVLCNDYAIGKIWLSDDSKLIEEQGLKWFESEEYYSLSKSFVFADLNWKLDKDDKKYFQVTGSDINATHFAKPLSCVVNAVKIDDKIFLAQNIEDAKSAFRVYDNLRSEKFTDVPAFHEYYDETHYLKKHAIINGNDDGTFKPNDILNRAELAQLIFNATWTSVNESYAGATDKYCMPDISPQWFAVPVCLMYDKGWISGYPDGLIRPATTVNRAEALKIIFNSHGVKVNELQPDDPWFKPFYDKALAIGAIDWNADLAGAVSRGEAMFMLYQTLRYLDSIYFEA